MKERLYRTLNIKHSESSQVFDLLSVQFFIGLANALVNIIAFTFFVHNFPISELPLVYLVIAAVLILLNFVYEKLEHMFSPLRLLKYIISFSAILFTILWIGLTYGNENDFVFALLVTSVLVYMLVGYAFWGLVSLLFNVRESRRVFSIVGSGDIPAKLIGYVVAPLLVPLMGLTNMMWFAICSLVIAIWMYHRFTKKKRWHEIKSRLHEHHNHHDDHTKSQFRSKDLVNFFFKSKLIFAISLLSLLSYNVFVLVDFTFVSQIKLRYEKINDLALYISVFFAFGRLIALGLKLIFTSRLIERLGVIYCLFITPAALFLFCLLFIIYGTNSTYNLYIFGLMAMLTEVLRSTMQEPVFFILFQPLKENLRLKGHIISKGYMYPPAFIIVGASLLLLNRAGIEFTIMLAIKVVIINLCIWAAIIFFIRRAYLHTIHASIKKGIFNTDDIYFTDRKTIEILLNKIETGKRIETIYALNLLEQSDHPGFDALLEKQLVEAKDTAVKKYALERLDVMGKINVNVLRNMLPLEVDIELRQKIVSLLCKYDMEFLKTASENMNSYEYAIRKIIIVSSLNQYEFNFQLMAENEINTLLNSADPAERLLAVEVIGELKEVLLFTDAIEKLINDEEISVKKQAMITACKLRMSSVLPMVIDHLAQPAHKNIVLKAAQVYGDFFFKDIIAIKLAIPVKYLPDFIKIAGKLKGPHSTAFLLSKLDDEHTEVKNMILHALWIKEYEPGTAEKEKFADLLNSYLKTALDKKKDYNEIPDFNDKELVKNSIYNEVRNDLAIALKTCAILFSKKEINRVLELMTIARQNKIYNAMEMLELVLPKKISKDLNLLFDFILDPQHNSKVVIKNEIKVFFDKAIFDAPLMYNPWTKSVCVYSSWKNNETFFLQKLKNTSLPYEHYLVKETTDYVLATIK